MKIRIPPYYIETVSLMNFTKRYDSPPILSNKNLHENEAKTAFF